MVSDRPAAHAACAHLLADHAGAVAGVARLFLRWLESESSGSLAALLGLVRLRLLAHLICPLTVVVFCHHPTYPSSEVSTMAQSTPKQIPFSRLKDGTKPG